MIVWTAAQQALARYEVARASGRGFTRSHNSTQDVMAADILPSGREGGTIGGIIGEIDQDGYVFTIDPRDQQFFPSRPIRNPKRHHRLDLVLRSRTVCVRKMPFPTPQARWSRRISRFLKDGFWMEAAALLRMRGCKGVPILRSIDRSKSAIEIDYIRGENLRNVLSRRIDGFGDSGLGKLIDTLKQAEPGLSLQLIAILEDVINRGVVPRDVHAGNFILANDSGFLYMVDFHLSWLRPAPPFARAAAELRGILR